MKNSDGISYKIHFYREKNNPFKGLFPKFYLYSFPSFDYNVCFLQKNGQPINTLLGTPIYHSTNLHADPPVAADYNILLEGRKRFYLMHPKDATRMLKDEGTSEEVEFLKGPYFHQ